MAVTAFETGIRALKESNQQSYSLQKLISKLLIFIKHNDLNADIDDHDDEVAMYDQIFLKEELSSSERCHEEDGLMWLLLNTFMI